VSAGVFGVPVEGIRLCSMCCRGERWFMEASRSMDARRGDGFRAFATEAGTESGTVETIAAQLLTFRRRAIRTLHGDV
jgi:hypothetical protein